MSPKSFLLKGANLERSCILARIRRMMKNGADAVDLVTWIKTRHDRYNKRKGGLGK